MSDTHPLMNEIAHSNSMKRHIIDRFIHRQRVAGNVTQIPSPVRGSNRPVRSASRLTRTAVEKFLVIGDELDSLSARRPAPGGPQKRPHSRYSARNSDGS
jgi:hypothetical protein